VRTYVSKLTKYEEEQMKKVVVIVLVLLMAFSSFACNKQTEPVNKIGIVTGTVSQGEEEYLAAQNMKKKYGDMIVTATYPDKFQEETETTISLVTQMAADESVKAIVFVQAVPGAAAAIDKVRETRDDILFICGVVHEDPSAISERADIAMLVDELSMGERIPKKAKEMGAKTLIHYSFPRHMGYATIKARYDIMVQTCQEIGLEFVAATALDPTGEAGMSGAQQFIVDDLPRKIEEYGKDTAFFSTNCGLQEPLIRGILNEGAIYPQQCCPSPYHAYPSALNVDVKGHEGDMQYMLDQIGLKLKEAGQEKRMSTWGVAINMLMIEAGVEYAKEFIEGKITERNDQEALKRIIDSLAGGVEVTLSKYVEDGKELDNFYLMLADFYDFSK
jgi:hypothetical protein